jgi:outer membrane protein assembly factor BamB
LKLAAVGILLAVASIGFAGCKSDPPDPPDPPAARPQLAAANAVAVLTQHNDNARTGQDLHETILRPSNVNVARFGQLGKLPVVGGVDAEPLYVPGLAIDGATRDVLYVATEHGVVYAFDADTLSPPLWQASVIPAGEVPSDDQNCAQVTPEIGITATPVIDLHAGPHGTIFIVAMSKDSAGKYHQRLHALDLVTHAELDGGPVEIQATQSSLSGPIAFDPRQYEARSALLLANGRIYMGWSSHCDAWPYTGWIMAYSETTLRQTSVLNLTPNGSAGAIWMSGGGMAADSAGNIFLLDGNGTFDPKLDAAGMPVNADFGNAFLKLSPKGNTLRVADYFAPHDTVLNSNQDRDLGSGGLLLLPDLKDDRGVTRHLAIGAGKADFSTGKIVIYVVNRDAMGKFNPHSDQALYQKISNGLRGTDGVFALPAYFNNTVYYGAQGDYLKAFPISCAKLAARAASHSPTKFPYPGATPSVSADGAENGIVWAVEASVPGVLHAYDAENLANELYNSNQASGGRDQFVENKFITPLIANGKVYIGTPDSVAVFGLLDR